MNNGEVILKNFLGIIYLQIKWETLEIMMKKNIGWIDSKIMGFVIHIIHGNNYKKLLKQDTNSINRCPHFWGLKFSIIYSRGL